MIKMKYYVNIKSNYAKAVECADHLIQIAELEGISNKYVIDALGQDPDRRAYFLM